MFLRKKNKTKKVVEPKSQIPKKKSRWWFVDTHFKDVEEEKRLKGDCDYRAFKNQNPF